MHVLSQLPTGKSGSSKPYVIGFRQVHQILILVFPEGHFIICQLNQVGMIQLHIFAEIPISSHRIIPIELPQNYAILFPSFYSENDLFPYQIAAAFVFSLTRFARKSPELLV